MADHVLTAPAMARAATSDPQFTVPVHPRVRRGVSIHRDGAALVVDGTPTRHRLRGRAATDLVPTLLPLLDGHRDVAAIAAAAGHGVGPVFAALSLLWTCGVTEEAAPPGVDAAAVPDHLADHLSRVGDSTQANPAWELAAARLREARVEVFGAGPLPSALVTAAGAALTITPGTGATPDPATTLAVVVDGAEPTLAPRCWDAGLPLLRVRLSGPVLHIGPYVDPALGPCLDCLTDGEPDTGPDNEAPGPDPVLAAGFVAADLVGLVSRAYPVPLPVRWHRIDLDRFARTQQAGASRPGCRRCSAAPPTDPPRAPALATRYEAAVALPPRRYADPKAHQAHYKPANVALQRGHKTWPAAPRVTLAPPDLDRLTHPPAGAVLSVDDLGLLLALAAGWRADTGDRVRRWTASGGNIGSVVAHVIVRDVAGVPPGVYGYVAATHELATLRADPPPGAGTTVVLTADLPRVASKYGAFGLRVTLLDAGCATATLVASADALGVACRCEPVWDDAALADLLGVDPDAEPVTAVLTLGEVPR